MIFQFRWKYRYHYWRLSSQVNLDFDYCKIIFVQQHFLNSTILALHLNVIEFKHTSSNNNNQAPVSVQSWVEPSGTERNRRRFHPDGSWYCQPNGENIIYLENLWYVWHVGKIKFRNYEPKEGILATTFVLIIEPKKQIHNYAGWDAQPA